MRRSSSIINKNVTQRDFTLQSRFLGYRTSSRMRSRETPKVRQHESIGRVLLTVHVAPVNVKKMAATISTDESSISSLKKEEADLLMVGLLNEGAQVDFPIDWWYPYHRPLKSLRVELKSCMLSGRLSRESLMNR